MAVIPYARLKKDLLSLYSPPFKRAGTYRKIRQVLCELEMVVDDGRPPKPLIKRSSDLRPAAIAAWLQQFGEGRGPATKLSLLRAMRTVTRYAEFYDHLKACPFRWRSPQKWILDELESHQPKERNIPAIDVFRVLAQADAEASSGDWCNRRLRALIYTLAYSGARKREILGLKVSDLNFADRLLTIEPNERRKLKTPKSRAKLGMPRELIRVLKPWSAETGCIWLFPGTRRKGPWIDGAPGSRALDQVKALGERAGVKGLTILSFRHTIGTLAEPAGLDQLELQRQLRHTNTKTQHGYRHLDEDNVRRIADKLARGYKSAIAGVPRELLSPRVG